MLSWGGFSGFSVDGGGLTSGKDSVVMKHEDDSAFTVKIQGAGLEAFEMQVKELFLWTCVEKVYWLA